MSNKAKAKADMLAFLDDGIGILTAAKVFPDVPTIHDIPDAKHLGFGAFAVEVEGAGMTETALFQAGGAMNSVEELKDPKAKMCDAEYEHILSWTPIRGSISVYYWLGIDLEKQHAAISAW